MFYGPSVKSANIGSLIMCGMFSKRGYDMKKTQTPLFAGSKFGLKYLRPSRHTDPLRIKNNIFMKKLAILYRFAGSDLLPHEV